MMHAHADPQRVKRMVERYGVEPHQAASYLRSRAAAKHALERRRRYEIEDIPEAMQAGHNGCTVTLRRYGAGSGVIARGLPAMFMTREAAVEAGDIWVEYAVSVEQAR